MISFYIENRMFYFDIELIKEIKDLSLFPKIPIDQKFLNYYQKIEVFIEALKQSKEEKKIDTLYEDAIKLFSKKK